ncbi:peptidylprolyl isomerase [Pelomonas sp. BJYL3]|uniref:peptidylprolyl isomerase n=1 Tax=Pelomonas sp. BJYL3 TaxID=2976697 RepID=UPI0022B4ACFA|nr:peptidylprolyl isomerase [Pelomonas sp. BJYL3]
MSGCGGGSCGCGGGKGEGEVAVETLVPIAVARVNDVALHGAGEVLGEEALRQRAYGELLRQAAQRAGLLASTDPGPIDGVHSEAASEAIEALLAREIQLPEPDDAACLRYYEAHPQRFARGERVRAAHILLAVTPGVDVGALRAHAEGLLVRLRCEDEASFAKAAAENSNCPSGEQGGGLGWLTREDCLPEVASVLFAQDDANRHMGVLPRLLSSRHGFHILRVDEREAGEVPSFEQVRGSVAALLRHQLSVTAMRQYLDLLAGQAQLQGVSLNQADTPLVQ